MKNKYLVSFFKKNNFSTKLKFLKELKNIELKK